jgi:hypothetical protein
MREEVADLGQRLGIDEDHAFTAWYAKVALRLDDAEALEAMSYDGGNDRGIDFFLVDDERERIIVGQSKYFKKSDRNPKPAELTHLFNTAEELTDPQELRDAGRDDLADAGEDYLEARLKGWAGNLHLIYPGRQNDELDRLVRGFNQRNLRENISAAVIKLDDLELLYEDYVGTVGRVLKGTLQLGDSERYEEDNEAFGRALVCTIPGASLKALYIEHGNRLFDQNVRLFLGTRTGSVNAGIRDTLKDPAEREYFWAYNNGITIVATSFEVDDEADVVTMDEFSIVNGCQTTVSIGESSDAAANDVAVLARVVAAKPDLVDSIIRFTNSQTPIAIWDISARDKVQQRLKRELEELDEPWFYSLRRGEFDTLQNKDDFGPYGARRVLPFPLSVQFLGSLRGIPVEAYKDKARLFTVHKDKVFPNDVTAADVLWAWTVGQAVERAIKKYKGEIGVDETTEPILKRGTRFFVTAVAGQLLRLRNGQDVFAKLDVKRILDKAMMERLDNYAYTATIYYVAIMRELIRTGSDLAVLLKTTDTATELEQRVRERFAEDKLAPKALEEKLPLLPGIAKKKVPAKKKAPVSHEAPRARKAVKKK